MPHALISQSRALIALLALSLLTAMPATAAEDNTGGALPLCAAADDTVKEVVGQQRAEGTANWLRTHERIALRVGRGKTFRIAFVGDSLLAHWPRQNGEFLFDDEPVLNLAMGGDQTQNVLWRLQNMALEEAAPEQVVLLIGTNNLRRGASVCGVVQGVRAVAHTLQQQWPEAHLTLVGLLPRGAKLDFRWQDRLEINRQLREHAASIGATFVEPDPVFLCEHSNKCGYYVKDMVHLTPAGYAALRDALHASLKNKKTATLRRE